MASFGGAGLGQKVIKPNPPERGSFPLDHDGECKDMMLSYLRCIKSHRGTNDSECRNLSKAYLSCRMDRSLGTLGLEAARTQGRDAAALIPHLLSDLKRLACQIGRLPALSVHQRSDTVLYGTVAPSTISTSPHITVALRRQHPNKAHRCPKQNQEEHVTDSIGAHRNLMAPDSFKNLGFGEDGGGPSAPTPTATPAHPPQPQGNDKPRTS
ncbi:hypothetical protein ST47_g10413 [Ascochyta rabiei]|uniref:Uncharacterized protein n=1 Tax=Didymella rabiei TaxID=5454 RepID=A0A162VI31_DIDRA|nr:hypothetical protein ST47_g10413 [Ascochyta rabiei]